MPVAGAARTNFDRYITSKTNQYINDSNKWLGMFDDGIFKVGQHSAALGQQISQLQDNSEAASKCGRVADGFGIARDAIGAVRFIPALHNLFTGQSFWQTDSEGWRKVAFDRKNNPVSIPREDLLNGTWKKKQSGYWEHTTHKWKSYDGKYIDNSKGRYEHKHIGKDWKDIVMNILVVIARVLSPVRWLHSLKGIDLGEHAKTLGGITMGIWGAVLTIGFVQSVENAINETDVAAMTEKNWDAFQGFIDLVSIPFDFGAGAGHPALAITGAVLNIISGTSLILKEGFSSGWFDQDDEVGGLV